VATKGVESGLVRGYTRVPNSLLMRMVSGECSKHEIQILLFVVRMTVSFRRALAPISKSVVEKFTGIRGSGVLHALAALESAGLIKRIPGNERQPSRVGLQLDPDWDWLQTESEQSSSVSRSASNLGRKTTQGSFLSQGSNQSRDVFVPRDRIDPVSPGGINPTRNYIIQNNKNSLSQVSEKLRAYIDEVTPKRKRESEIKALQELQNDFSDEDIAECLNLVRERGIGRGEGEGNEVCHSPMAYLAKAMKETLAKVNAVREKEKLRLARVQQEAEQSLQKAEEEAREKQEFEIKERAFNRAFLSGDRQQEVISELCRGMPFSRHSVAARLFSIGKWWDSLNSYERTELT
jgi:hypothetical protein